MAIIGAGFIDKIFHLSLSSIRRDRIDALLAIFEHSKRQASTGLTNSNIHHKLKEEVIKSWKTPLANQTIRR